MEGGKGSNGLHISIENDISRSDDGERQLAGENAENRTPLIGDNDTQNYGRETNAPKQTNISTPAQQPTLPTEEAFTSSIRFRKRSLFLLACYLPFLLVPWILTCVLAVRPLNQPSYINQKAEYRHKVIDNIQFWLGFVRVLNAVAALLTVPVISALLAHGAVVFTQRRKARQRLNLQQTFALADRGWADLPTLWKTFSSKGPGSRYLWLAAVLLLIGALQAPVQQAVVGTETINILTCRDNPTYSNTLLCDKVPHPITILGYDPEPYDLARIPQNVVIRDVSKQLAMAYEDDFQIHLWHDSAFEGETDYPEHVGTSSTLGWYYKYSDIKPKYYAAALPNNTMTGVLRQHAMRLNSSVQCNLIEENSYPTTCDGELPLVTSFKRPGDLSIDICVPGNRGSSPWTLSRDRQDIVEELFIKVNTPADGMMQTSYLPDTDVTSFAVRCTGNTTRGYFELGNALNDFKAGPLIEKWPDFDTLKDNFNDYLTSDYDSPVPHVIDRFPDSAYFWSTGPDAFYTNDLRTPGPLMTSALAMFGNESFFFVAANSSENTYPYVSSQLCQSGNIPFLRLDVDVQDQFGFLFGTCSYKFSGGNIPTSDDFDLMGMLYSWFSIFKKTKRDPYEPDAIEALEIAMFFANEAWLTQTAAPALSWNGENSRAIYTSEGTTVHRPHKTLAGTVIVSVLIVMQVLGLLMLAWYIYSVPTWTTKLDAYAVAQLAKSLDDDVLLPLGLQSKGHVRKLRDVDGMVGVPEQDSTYEPARGAGKTPSKPSITASENEDSGDSQKHRRKDDSTDRTSNAENPSEVERSSLMSYRLARGSPGVIVAQDLEQPRQRSRWWKKKAGKESLLEKAER